MKKSILSLLIFTMASMQTVWAQKVLIYKSDDTTVEYETADIDSMVFVQDEPVTIPSYLTCPDDNHPHAIDLGLPSGTKWCCCNVGASSPEEYGGYYAWGETWEKDTYTWKTYTYYKEYPNGTGITKYSLGIYNYAPSFDGKRELDLNDDAARVRMGAPWRMPSAEQMRELVDNCSRRGVQQNGVNSLLMTGPNGSQISLPLAGRRTDENGIENIIDKGYYWTRSLHLGGDGSAVSPRFGSNGSCDWYGDLRFNGHSIRAVCP